MIGEWEKIMGLLMIGEWEKIDDWWMKLWV